MSITAIFKNAPRKYLTPYLRGNKTSQLLLRGADRTAGKGVKMPSLEVCQRSVWVEPVLEEPTKGSDYWGAHFLSFL